MLDPGLSGPGLSCDLGQDTLLSQFGKLLAVVRATCDGLASHPGSKMSSSTPSRFMLQRLGKAPVVLDTLAQNTDLTLYLYVPVHHTK